MFGHLQRDWHGHILPFVQTANEGVEFLHQGDHAGNESVEEDARDRRKSPRFELQVPFMAHWIDASGQAQSLGGFTRNIGMGGVFVWHPGECPPAETAIECEVLLPGLHPTFEALRMHGKGQVLRVQDLPKGFAARVHNWSTDALNRPGTPAEASPAAADSERKIRTPQA